MTQEQANQVKIMKERLLAASSDWPRDVWSGEDHYAAFLEQLLARAVGDREIVLATATVTGRPRQDVSRFEAVIFTERLIFSAGIDVPQTQPNLRLAYPQGADVAVIPRSAVKAVTLHELHNFGENGGDGSDIVGFTVTFDGHPPVVVNLPRWSHGSDGAHSRLFDSLVDGLAGRGK